MKDLCWPGADGARALEAVAFAAKLAAPSVRLAVAVGGEAPAEWIPRAAAALGLEAEPIVAQHAEVEALVRSAAPALFVLDDKTLLVVSRGGRRSVEVLAPDGQTTRVPVADVARRLTAAIEGTLGPEIDRTIAAAGVTGARAARVRRALLAERLASRHAAVAWCLRSDPGESSSRALARLGLLRRGAQQVALHLGKVTFTLAGWWLLGRSMFSDRLDSGSVIASSLLFAGAIVCEVGESWVSGTTSLSIGGWLRQRLLVGALRLRPDDVRLDGVGAHLGRVIESESVQAVALTSATGALLGLVELIAAVAILSLGAGGLLQGATLVVWAGVLATLLARYVTERRRWTDERLRMSAKGIERMLGYETRLVTEALDEWSVDEDRELAEYVERSRKVDARLRHLSVLVANGWLLVGLLGLVPTLLVGDENPIGLAIAIGGVLLAYDALGNFAQHAALVVDAGIGWRQVAPLFDAAARKPKPSMGLRSQRAADVAQLEMRDVSFAYAGRSGQVLDGASLRIETGDRVLIDGPSGAGKSTIAALLGGLRSPTNGLVLHGGLDIHAVGEEPWRKSIAIVPQFHDNHVLTGTLAFNLLLGRDWPPSPSDLALAEQTCVELGLGPLLERMPSQLMTLVGETGWQLSHGERSRVFLARALLQKAEVVLLDETLAALDPDNLAVCIRTAMERSTTLIVIAHLRREHPSKWRRGATP